jgi:hypothetical protein
MRPAQVRPSLPAQVAALRGMSAGAGSLRGLAAQAVDERLRLQYALR